LAEKVLDLLGWEVGTLRRFLQADQVVVTLPHASPNVFFPRVGVAWYTNHLQEKGPAVFHIRAILTHTNFSDAGWKPYAWWYVDRLGELRRETVFTRNKKHKHRVVASQPPLDASLEKAGSVDQDAARLARVAGNLAVSCMIVMARVERAAGFTAPGTTLYVPLDLILRCFRDLAEGRSGEHPWLTHLLANGQGRRLTLDGELEATEQWSDAWVLDNASNIAALTALGHSGVIGGSKMSAYWADVEQRVTQANSLAQALHAPGMLLLPPREYSQFVAPSAALRESLGRASIAYSQGMAVWEHGSFGLTCQPFR